MGLFDSGGKGNSRANTSSSSTTTNETTTLIDNSVHTSDFGAVQAALDIGLEALRMGGENLTTSADLAGRGLDTALDATRSALDFSESVVGSNERLARDSILAISDFGGVALGEVTNFARDLTEANLSGLTSLARQTSESADDRVSRVAMYAFAAIAAVFVLPALFKAS